MTTTLDPLADMLAEIDAGAEPVKKNSKKTDVPVLHAQHLLNAGPRMRELKREMTDREVEYDGLAKDFIDLARPFQLDESRKRNIHLASVKVNDVSIQCRPPHYLTKISDKARIGEVAALFGPRFTQFFRVVRLIPETPEVVAALKAAGVKYCCAIAPLKALHEARSTEAGVAKILESVPEIKPIWAALAGKE